MAKCRVCGVCCVLIFVIFYICMDIVIADILESQIVPEPEFRRHVSVKPKIYHGREKRQISSSTEEGGTHIHDLTITYNINGTDYLLDLALNRGLLPKGYFEKYQQNGKHVINKPEGKDSNLCQYQGSLRGIIGSWAAVSTCHKGLSGVIYDGNDLHYIEKANASNVHTGFNDVHHVYKHSDLIDTNKKCGYASSTPDDHHILENNEYNRILRYKRSIDDGSTLRGPYNANKQSRYVELVLVVDQLEYKSQEENLNKVYSRCKDIANIINALYAPLNIFIALVGVVVWTETDEIKLSENGDNTLTNFLHYRRERLVKEHPNDNAQLLTQVKFEGGVVGKALKGPICTFEFSGGVSMDHSSTVGLVATTIAHEMGHNFGMEHDSADCKCPDEKCIMSPSSSSQSPKHWSSCSLAYLALAFERGMDYCLRNKPEQLFGSPVCGNGFVEPGEQCDCGLEDRCANPCCNATTCMLHSNASCATGECCDLMTCKPKSAGTVCRSADHECDLPEYCTGQSEYCPSDVYKMDTETCDSGRAFCYQGSCRTRSDQCKLLWGPSGRSSDDQCYNMNTKGSRHGNCGYNRLNQTYIKCTDENVFCGMLHCRHLNEKLEFGMESVAILSHSFINSKGSIIPCRTAIVDLGLNQIDPGLTPDGAKCGDGKMCVNQKCMTVENLRLSIAQETACSKNCGGNGVCNSKGHCHCNNGFAPPDCEYPGVGGSEDSGPASDPNALRVFMMFMYIVFLGIIPLIAISALLCYYRKHTLPSWPKGSSKTSKTAPKNHRGNLAFQSAPQIIEINSRTDDNSTLLPQSESCTLSDSSVNNDFFGHFKGFSLTPLSKPEEVQTPPSLATDASKVFNKTSDTKLVPQRSAPPVPVVPNTIIKSPKPILRSHTSYAGKPVLSVKPIISKSEPTKSNSFSNHVECAPALPPLNPGSHPRPLISSPILENSTCTAKELISPLKNAPKMPVRPAPEAPADIQLKNIQKTRPLSTIEDETSKNKPGSALNRIASFLKSQKDDKSKVISGTNSLPRNAHHVVKPVKSVIDKNSLKNIEISSPILQNEINIPSNTVDIKDNKNNIVMRAQSMRAPVDVQRPNIPNFGSMRQKSIKRPTSIPVGNRPTSPPPPRPPTSIDSEENVVINKIPGLPGYQVPQNDKKDYSYDDCVAKKSAPLADIKETSPTDNIYAVIEDSPVKKPDIISPVSNYQSPKPLESTSKSGSTESMGLLGEIVSEIQNRNFDSIYSTSTLARKKKEREREKAEKEGFSDIETDSSENKNDGSDSVYDSTIYKHPDSVYCNMAQQKSSASSTTSSGYLNPSAVNVPVKNNPEIEIKNNVVKPLTMSTFKENNDTKKNIEVNSTEYKPFQSTLQRKAGPFAATFKNNTSLNKVAEKEENSANIKQINTPPRLSVKAETPSVVKSTNNHLPKTKSDTPTSIKSITRQITPPSLSARPKTETKNLTRQPTPPHLKKQSTPPKLQPTRTVPPIPRSNSKQGQLSNSDNSPDIVSSCASNTNVKKSPDVVSNNVTFDQSNKNPAKPNIVSKPVLNGDIKKPPNISSKPNVDKTTGNFKSLGGKNVASLQQKFEQNKPAVNKKTNNINNVRIKSIPLNK